MESLTIQSCLVKIFDQKLIIFYQKNQTALLIALKKRSFSIFPQTTKTHLLHK